MKKVLNIIIGLYCTSTLSAQVAVNLPTDRTIDPMAAFQVCGTARIDTLPPIATPVHIVVLGSNDSILHTFPLSLLSTFLGQTPSSGDLVGWGYSIFNLSTTISPPVSFFKDRADKIGIPLFNGVTEFVFQADTFAIQERNTSSDWAGVSNLSDFYIKGGVVSLNGYLYVAMRYQGERRVYRYDRTNLAAGGTMMNFLGSPYGDIGEPVMTSNGADFFFTHNAGNSNEDNIIAKYSVSGTTFNYILSSTIGSSGDFARSVLVDIDGNYYALSISTPKYLKKFSPIGTLLRTNKTNAQYLLNWANQYYSLVSHSINSYEKFNK